MLVEARFHLNQYIKDVLRSSPVPWGFGTFSEAVFYRTYSRELPDGSPEQWSDVVIRVTEGVMSIRKDWYLKHGIKWNEDYWQLIAGEMATAMFNMHFLPAGRGLRSMGTDYVYERGSHALNNCFSGDTKILTLEHGVAELRSLAGSEVSVMTESGWRLSHVKSFGRQPVQRITFAPAYLHSHGWRKRRSNLTRDVVSTPDHRWLLVDGSETTSLSVGDVVRSNASSFRADGPSEDLTSGFIHGLIFADGTQTYEAKDGTRSFTLRLCGKKREYAEYFENVTYPKSNNGDPQAYVKSDLDLKSLPPSNVSHMYVHGFIQGWIAGDGDVTRSGSIRVSSQDGSALDWLEEYAPYAGFIVTGRNTESVLETNFGPRSAPLQRLTLVSDSCAWKVVSIEPLGEEEVFCPVVPEEHAFTLAGGIYTGNCGFTEVKDDLAYAAGWLMDSLMLGVGVGFSTANASFGEARIPDSDDSTTIVIPDSREGWVMSVEALINSYFRGSGKPVEFDYSHIRPEGSPIRGFGGIASGPEPLMKLHERLRGYLNQYATGEVDRTRLITDVMNAIGACVVAGNVRRSAELATGSLADSTFLNLKNYELNPDRAEIGWMCLPRDTWITTDQGPRQIRDLIGTPFNAVVDGKTYPSQGFFPSGEKEVVEIHAQGYVLRSSPEHKIMTTRGWVPAGNLAVGDLIRLHDHGSDLSWGGPGTEDEGFVLGAIVGDGWLTNNGTIIIGSSASDPGSKEFQEEFLRVVQQYPRFHKKRDYEWVPIAGKDELRLSCTSLKDLASQFGIEPGNKTITPEIEGASREFYVGFLRGLFDTDGSIEVLGATKNARGVRLSNSDEQVIRGTQRMLSRLGIRSKVHEITTNHGFIKRKTPYALLIRGEHARRFGELIGFTNSRKAQLLAEQGVTRRSNKSHLARVERVVRTGTTEPMYDCMVEEVHAYDANGIYVSNSNNSVVLSESDHFLKLPEIADRIRDNGEPGVINLMNVQKYGRFKEKKPDLAVGFNPCVPGHTRVLTRHGYAAISSLVDIPTEIWNGEEWSLVIPKVTGYDQPILKITFSDGTELTTTHYHGFYLSESYHQREPTLVEAKDLRPGMKLWKYDMPVVEYGEEVPLSLAYTQGVYAGDGHYSSDRGACVWLYGDKFPLGDRLNLARNSFYHDEKRNRTLVKVEVADLKKTFVPHDWSLEGRLAWLAGLLDTGGTLLRDGSLQITSVERDFLREARLMLTTLGVQAKVGLSRLGGMKPMPDGKGGKKKYRCRDTYRLLISATDVVRLRDLGIEEYLQRIDVSNVSPNRDARRFVRVVSVEDAGIEPVVYCFNEPINHTGTFEGVVTGQCAEIPLEHAELCNLAEVFPTRCSSTREILKAMDLATIYASTVALLPSHRRDTNEVVERNRRIGVSISGVADWLDSTSVAHLTKILRTGYEDVVMPRNKLLAVEAGVPESVRLTTVKPSGTISQLVGVSPGMHWPVHRYYIRRMRVGHNSPIVELLISSGLPYEQDKWDPETLVFEFPQESGQGKTRSVSEVSIWEQASMVAFLQREWADNAVSNTLTFNPETEGKDIEKVLSMYAPQIKSMSMLPGSNDVYEQMPYERITRSEYLERMAKLKPIDWSVLRGNDGIDVKYCDGDVCELPT